MKTYKKVDRGVWSILGVLFAYIALVPFYYFQSQSLQGPPVFSLVKYLPFVLVGGVFCLWVISVIGESRPVVSTSIDRYLGLYLVVALFSLWGADFALMGLGKWMYYNTTGPILCFLVVQYCSSWAEIRRAALFMSFVSGVVVSYTFFFAISGQEPLWDAVQRMYSPYYTQGRAMGPFGHTVATATFTMLLFPLAVWTLSVLQRGWLKVGWGIVCALFLPVVLLTQTRGTQLATLLCCVLMVPWLKKVGLALGQVARGKLYGGLVIGGLLVLTLSQSFLQSEKIGHIYTEARQRWSDVLEIRPVTVQDGDKIYRYDSMLEYTERFRIAQYHTVGKILAEHPLLGVGFGTFTREFEQYRYAENYMVREFPEHTTENMYLMFLAEMGIAGLVSSLGVMLAIFLVVLRAWQLAADGPQKDLLWVYLASYISLAFNMLTWDILNEPTMRMTYWLWTGLALGVVRIVRVVRV